jgi:hypothetical protein
MWLNGHEKKVCGGIIEEKIRETLPMDLLLCR